MRIIAVAIDEMFYLFIRKEIRSVGRKKMTSPRKDKEIFSFKNPFNQEY